MPKRRLLTLLALNQELVLVDELLSVDRLNLLPRFDIFYGPTTILRLTPSLWFDFRFNRLLLGV